MQISSMCFRTWDRFAGFKYERVAEDCGAVLEVSEKSCSLLPSTLFHESLIYEGCNAAAGV